MIHFDREDFVIGQRGAKAISSPSETHDLSVFESDCIMAKVTTTAHTSVERRASFSPIGYVYVVIGKLQTPS